MKNNVEVSAKEIGECLRIYLSTNNLTLDPADVLFLSRMLRDHSFAQDSGAFVGKSTVLFDCRLLKANEAQVRQGICSNLRVNGRPYDN